MPTEPVILTRPRATIRLDAVAANYRRILVELGGVPAAAVVKANGYGLGAEPVARTLWAEGCRRFFVARVDEGVALRAALPEAELDVFDGVLPGTERELVEHRLVPIINGLDQLVRWRAEAERLGRPLPAGLHLDTGMRRLGFSPTDYERLVAEPALLDRFEVRHVLSHLASADIAGHPQSAVQLTQFRRIRAALPMGAASLSNSAGIFLGPDYHFDLARPGISLYGGSPFPDSGRTNPMRATVVVEAPIVQVRQAEPGETVGYGATHRIDRPSLIATVPVGYADGFLRSASSAGDVVVAGTRAPIIGRVSMDLITIDVTGIDERCLYPGAPVELMGERRPVDEVAERAGSIPHELLTNLGGRFERRYVRHDGDRDQGDGRATGSGSG